MFANVFNMFMSPFLGFINVLHQFAIIIIPFLGWRIDLITIPKGCKSYRNQSKITYEPRRGDIIVR